MEFPALPHDASDALKISCAQMMLTAITLPFLRTGIRLHDDGWNASIESVIRQYGWGESPQMEWLRKTLRSMQTPDARRP